MRIAVAGNQWITSYLLDALHERGLTPKLVINMPPERSTGISGYVDLAEAASRLRAELYRPHRYSLKSEVDEIALKGKDIDQLFVFGWQRLIPGWLLDRCRLGAFGVHGGPEPPPRCRGRAVFNWALLLGYTHFHIYAFRLTPGVDDGEIVGLTTFDILPHDDILTVYHKNCVVSSRLFLRIAEEALRGTLRSEPQAREGATYLPKRSPENGGIEWSRSAKRIVDLIRALAPPYPSAFSDIGSSRVFIYRAHLFDTRINYDATPGTIVDVFPNNHFVVVAGDAAVYVRDWSASPDFAPRKGASFAPTSGSPLPDPVV
jgi:methionyl-tRNA formyltransferase